MAPAESITASTINAAYTLNRGDQIGSLEDGKLADFVIHDAKTIGNWLISSASNTRGWFT